MAVVGLVGLVALLCLASPVAGQLLGGQLLYGQPMPMRMPTQAPFPMMPATALGMGPGPVFAFPPPPLPLAFPRPVASSGAPHGSRPAPSDFFVPTSAPPKRVAKAAATAPSKSVPPALDTEKFVDFYYNPFGDMLGSYKEREDDKKRKDDYPLTPVSNARDMLAKAIEEANALNRMEPVAAEMGGRFWEKLEEVEAATKTGSTPIKSSVEQPAGPPSDPSAPKTDFQISLKRFAAGPIGPFEFHPENFRHLYWVYPFLGMCLAARFRTAHLFGFLPWAFYFANQATHVVSWDPNMWGQALTELIPQV